MSVYTREPLCEKDEIRLTGEGDTASHYAGSTGRVVFNHAAKSLSSCGAAPCCSPAYRLNVIPFGDVVPGESGASGMPRASFK